MTSAMESAAERLKKARLRAGLASARAAARKFGWNENTYKAHEGAKNGFDAEWAATYARAFNVSAGWLLTGEGFAERSASSAPSSAPRLTPNASEPIPTPRGGDDRIPILGVGRGGDDGRFELNGETIGYTMRPKSLIGVKGAYSIYVVGDSMEPRYEAGELVHVNPHKPPVPGRDVVVQIHATGEGEPDEGLIKRLVRSTPSYYVLRQFNPPLDFELERKIVKSVHLIVGRADE